jgi:hypothetical protein
LCRGLLEGCKKEVLEVRGKGREGERGEGIWCMDLAFRDRSREDEHVHKDLLLYCNEQTYHFQKTGVLHEQL